MSKEALVFYGNQEMRTTVIDNQMWWAIIDVCKVIGIKNNHDVAKKLDEDEKAEVDLIYPSSNGVEQRRKITMVNEPGLYHILLTSRSEKAKPFRRWVTHDVLPRIRKYGYYKLTPDEKQAEQVRGLLKDIGESLLALGKSDDIVYYERFCNNKELKEAKRMLEEQVYEKGVAEEREEALKKYPYTEDDVELFGIDVGLAITNMKSAGKDLGKYMVSIRTKELHTETLFNDAFVKQANKYSAVLDKERYSKYYLNA